MASKSKMIKRVDLKFLLWKDTSFLNSRSNFVRLHSMPRPNYLSDKINLSFLQKTTWCSPKLHNSKKIHLANCIFDVNHHLPLLVVQVKTIPRVSTDWPLKKESKVFAHKNSNEFLHHTKCTGKEVFSWKVILRFLHPGHFLSTRSLQISFAFFK